MPDEYLKWCDRKRLRTGDFTHEERLVYPREERARWHTGELIRKWACQYPEIFDEHFSNAWNQKGSKKRGPYHYFEWRAAVHFIEEHSYLSSLKYRHRDTGRALLKARLPRRLFDALYTRRDDRIRGGVADLFLYRRHGRRRWGFVEVKGPDDHESPRQKEFAKIVVEASGSPVILARFRAVSTDQDPNEAWRD